MLLKYPKGLNHTPTNCKLFDFRTTYSKPLFTFSSGFSLQELSSLCFSPTSLHVCLAGLSLHVSALPLSRHTFFWVTRFFLALDMHGRSTFLMLTRTLPSRATTVVLPLVVLSLSPAQWVIPTLAEAAYTRSRLFPSSDSASDSWVIWCTPANIRQPYSSPWSSHVSVRNSEFCAGKYRRDTNKVRPQEGVMDCVRVQQGDVWRGFPSLVVAITLAPQRFVPGSSTVQDDEPRAPGLAWGTRQHKRTMLHLRNWKTHIAATLGNLATRKGTMSSRRELEQERLSEVHRQVQTAVCSEPFAFNWKLQTATLRRQSLACSVMHLRSTRAEKNHSPCWGSKDAEAHNSNSLFVPDEVKMAQAQRGCAETSFERLQGHRGFPIPNPNRETGIQEKLDLERS